MTDDEIGMAWWNNLSELDRKKWAKLADTGRVKDAWEAYKLDSVRPHQEDDRKCQ